MVCVLMVVTGSVCIDMYFTSFLLFVCLLLTKEDKEFVYKLSMISYGFLMLFFFLYLFIYLFIFIFLIIDIWIVKSYNPFFFFDIYCDVQFKTVPKWRILFIGTVANPSY